MDKKKYNSILLLVKKFHSSQTRNNGKIPYWFHSQNVANIIKQVLEKTREGSSSLQSDLIIAGLCHDLYEDVPNSKKIIKNKFSKNIDRIISEITNEWSDNEVKEYVRKLKIASEEAILIKFADLYDNMMNAAYSISDNGLIRTKLWFSIMKPQWLVLRNYRFFKFKYSGRLLKNLVSIAYVLLEQAMANYQSIMKK